MFTTIVARDSQGGIAKQKGIPWYLPADLRQFRERTINNIVIMGRATYDSIGKPLPSRINIVLSNTIKEIYGCIVLNSFEGLLRFYEKAKRLPDYRNKTWFIIGGATLYNWARDNKLIAQEFITEIDKDYSCDTFYLDREEGDYRDTVIATYNLSHSGNEGISRQSSQNKHEHAQQLNPVHNPQLNYGDQPDEKHTEPHNSLIEKLFASLDEKPVEPSGILIHRVYYNVEEYAMLELMREIIKSGNQRLDRTGTGTLSLFGKRLEFDLSNNQFPLMTTRRLFFRGIFEELMFYLRGQTDNNILVAKGIHVWTPNTTREFLDKRGLPHLPVGDLGHSYGFSFRHFGANYVDCHADYTGQGYDQLEELIKELKTNPASRRLRISLWEPNAAHKAALPPCLEQYQFNVDDGILSCMMTQRSSDYFIAGGWNVITGALFTILLATICGLKPGKLIWNIGNVHIYNNLVEQANEQLKREPKLYPKLYIKTIKPRIEDYEFDDLELIGYEPHPPIKGIMNV